MADRWRIGQGWDIHRLEPGRKLVLGGVEVAFDRGLLGHSDADVLTHAVIDALLGAVGDADIGTRFPDSDPAWKNASSIQLLQSVVRQVRKVGWEVANIDATLVAEAPRIAPYRERMRECLAQTLGVKSTEVSIKAKTAEGFGAEGIGEAMSAQAVVLLRSIRAGPAPE